MEACAIPAMVKEGRPLLKAASTSMIFASNPKRVAEWIWWSLMGALEGGSLSFFELFFKFFSLDEGELINEKNAIEVVDLML